jgi:hypothetical protein
VLNELSTETQTLKWNGGIAPQFLTLALFGDDYLASRSRLFSAGIGLGYYWRGGWMGPTVRLDAVK